MSGIHFPQEIDVNKSFLARTGSASLLLAVLALGSAQAGATELINNGGFEADGQFTYSPSNWIVNEQGAFGAVAADSGSTSHASGYAAAGSASGNYYGNIDAYFLGAWSLAQTFSTGAVSQARLSFKMFVNDQSADGVAHVGSSLDYQLSPDTDPLHYVRVDVLKAGADSFATGTDIVKSLYIGGATGRNFDPNFNRYVNYSFDLSNVLAAGGNYTLRFAVANNMDSALQLGVDNVSLQVTAVPEPAPSALLLAGLGMIGAVVRRRNRR